MNLYGRFIQMAGDLRRWQAHTLTDHLVFSFQANVFIARNKESVARGLEIQGGVNWIKKTTGAFSLWAAVISPRSTMVQIPSGVALSLIHI